MPALTEDWGIDCPEDLASYISSLIINKVFYILETSGEYRVYESQPSISNVTIRKIYYAKENYSPFIISSLSQFDSDNFVNANTHQVVLHSPFAGEFILAGQIPISGFLVPSNYKFTLEEVTTLKTNCPGIMYKLDDGNYYAGATVFNLEDSDRSYLNFLVRPFVDISYTANYEGKVQNCRVFVNIFYLFGLPTVVDGSYTYTRGFSEPSDNYGTFLYRNSPNYGLPHWDFVTSYTQIGGNYSSTGVGYVIPSGVHYGSIQVDKGYDYQIYDAYVPTPKSFYSAFPNLIFTDNSNEFERLPTLPDETLEKLRENTKEEISGLPDDGSAGIGVEGLPEGSTEVNDSATGLYSRYLVSPATLVTLSDWLWTTGSEIFEALTNFLYGKPIDTVISLVSYPFNVGALLGTTGSTVKFGNNDTGVSANRLIENSASIDWGTINLSPINRNQNFLDMAPYTQLKLYLPWGAGFVDIDPSDVIDIDATGKFNGGSLGVVSNFEVAKGTVVHNIINSKGIVIGSYSTNAGRQIAVVGNDYAAKQIQVIAGVVGLAAVAAVAATGGIAAGTSAAFTPQTFAVGTSAVQSSLSAGLREGIKTAGSIASSRTAKRVAMASTAAIATAPMNVYRSGTFTEGSAGMGIQYPYLLVSQPKADIPQNYGSYYGYPCNKFVTLGSLSGYTEVGSVHLDGIPATESEMNELEKIIQGGIIL